MAEQKKNRPSKWASWWALLAGEFLKARRARIFPLTFAALALAPVMGAVFVVVLSSPELIRGNELLATKAAVTGFQADWPSYLNLLSQAVAIGGILLFGFAASWIFGREFTQKTVKNLLVLPVPRSRIVLVKFLVLVAWCLALVGFITLVALVLGTMLGLPGNLSTEVFPALAKLTVTTIMVLALSFPIGWVATISRGYLAPLGFVILMVILAQIFAALGLGHWFPWALPGLYAGIVDLGGDLGLVHILLLVTTGLTGVVGTVFWWSRTDQNL